MIKFKLNTLLNDNTIKGISKKREEYLNSGEDTLINTNSYVERLRDKLYKEEIIVEIKNIEDYKTYKVITLSSLNEEELPIFKAGNKISLTIEVDNKYYSKAYTIVSSPNRCFNGIYKIVVRNSEDVIDKYLYSSVSIGERIIISSPFGEFYYNKLRDKNNVIAIVSGNGILPIMSMIYSLIDNIDDYKLTVFYTEKYFEDILFYEELIKINKMFKNININIVLSSEDKDGCIKGFVTKKMIKDIIKNNNYSFFLSGTEGMLKYLNKELESLKLPKKLIRYEDYLPVCNIKKVNTYKLTLLINNEKYEVPCYNNKTIIQSIYESGIYIPSKCNVGSCGFCKSELLSGEVKIVNDKRDILDIKYNYIHPCSTYPLSDIKIIVR
ncbi:MAG: iron-sulfur cluster-binding domain-containing protein [Firmicutes bacterium]|nr:iron-sulfur cluster-binding domain-containing protein [Bacillota bacterium]